MAENQDLRGERKWDEVIWAQVERESANVEKKKGAVRESREYFRRRKHKHCVL